MRILTVTHYFDSNGAGVEIIAGKIRQELISHGHQVTWLAALAHNSITHSEPPDSECVALPAWDGIRVATDLAWPIPSPFSLAQIRRQVKAAEIIHLHEAFYPACQLTLHLARWYKKPIVITQHIADMPVAGKLRRPAVALANAVFTRPAHYQADRVVFISERSRAFFSSSAKGKDFLIYNGCDSSVFQPLPDSNRQSLRASLDLPVDLPVVLFVGRFIEKKGLALLQALCRARSDVSFVFIGHGPLDPTTWQLPHVRVLPQMSHEELRCFYQTADFLVLPAVGEGFPLVVQEALCSGLPCLVSQEIADGCPALADCFHITGPAGSRTLEVLNAQLHSLPDDATRRSLARRASDLWSWERCGRQYDCLFRGSLTMS